MYVSADTTLMYEYIRSANVINTTNFNTTVYTNTSKMGAWNIIPSIIENSTLNGTMYADVCGSDDTSTNCSSIRFMSYQDVQNDRYCTAFRTMTHLGACWPEFTSLNYTMPYGSAAWVYTQYNQTYNATRGITNV